MIKINKGILIIVIVLLLLGGGYWLMTQNKSVNTPSDVATPLSVPQEETANGEIVELTVEGSPFKFEPSTLTVNEGQTVRVNFVNLSGMHDFVIDELGVSTQVLGQGENETFEFVASQKGSFTFYCSVPGHRSQGMEGTLVVE